MSIQVYGMDELNRFIREGGLPLMEPIITNGYQADPNNLANSAHTLTVADGWHFTIDPSATRIITLPFTSVNKGNRIEIHNLAAAQKITIESSDGDDIATFQNGHMVLVAKQDTPTDKTHWKITDVSGGASPSFYANGDSAQTVVGSDFAEFPDLSPSYTHDTNDNYNVSTHTWTPTVPGYYYVHSQLFWNACVVADHLRMQISQGGLVLCGLDFMAPSTEFIPMQLSTHVDLDGTEGVTVVVNNFDRNTAQIIGGTSGSRIFMGHRVNSN